MRQAIIEHWIPALITAGIGGVMVAMLGPLFQSHFAESSAIAERKVKLTESVAGHVSGFIASHFQLVEIAKHEKSAPLSDQVRERKEEYRRTRDNHHYELRRDIVLVQHYFGDDVQKAIRAYSEFIKGVATADADAMPAREEFESHGNRIVSAMISTLKEK